jgi:hypothetical protein
MMLSLLRLTAICCLIVGVNACRNSSTSTGKNSPSNVTTEAHLGADEPGSVQFDLKPLSTGNLRSFECTYQARGKTARFRFEIKQREPMPGTILMAAAEGKFLAVQGSDNSALLQDLKKALDAKQIPTDWRRVKELPFDAVVLAENQSRGPSGGFSSSPPGDWIAIKIFLPRGRDEGEVFLNINPVLGKGEFSIKDSDYGDYLLREFAKVL